MSLHHMLRAAAGYQAPAPANTDPQFNYVSMLLHGDGTNGSQNNTFVDSSTNNFTITRNGNTTQGSLSPYGSLWSNYFDGSGDSLSSPTSTALNFGTGDFTVEAWVNIDSTVNPGRPDGDKTVTVFSTGSSGSDDCSFAVYGNNSTAGVGLEFYQVSPSIALAVAATVTPNTWVHIAFVRSGTTLYGFVNGTRYTFGTTSASISSGTTPKVGTANTASYTNQFKGGISNLRVVKGTAVYTSNFTPPTAPLTAISGTSLLTCQSNRFIDNSANNFTITRNGDARVTKESPFLPTAAYSTSTIGGSGYFDGSGDFLQTPTATALNFNSVDYTVEAWVYLDMGTYSSFDSGGRGIVSDYLSNSYSRWLLSVNTSGKLEYYEQDASGANGVVIADTANMPLNQWVHTAICKSGTTMYLFKNGVLIGTATSPVRTNFGGRVNIGQFTIDTSYRGYFLGYISNTRTIKGTALYTSNFTPPTAPLTAITNTSLLLNFTNAGIFDNAAENVLETVGNAQISTSVKKYGTGSLAFDGTGDWLLVPDNTNLQLGSGSFTVEGWVNLALLGSARGLVSKGTSTTGWSLSVNSLNQVVFTDATTAITTTTALMANTWYHVAVVRAGTGTNQTVIYINGVSSATGTSASNFNQTSVMYVGADRTGGSALNGYIDDLRITKGYARYTANFTPPTAAFPDQ